MHLDTWGEGTGTERCTGPLGLLARETDPKRPRVWIAAISTDTGVTRCEAAPAKFFKGLVTPTAALGVMQRRQQPSFLPPAEPRCAPGPTTRPGLSQPPGRVRGLARQPRVSAGNARPPVLTSSLCVDGHFFCSRPQFSRFPVCRCRVRARARSAPAARLSVSMAAAAGGDQAATRPQAGKEAAGPADELPGAGEPSARLPAPRGGTSACARARGRPRGGEAVAREGRAGGCGSCYCGRRRRVNWLSTEGEPFPGRQ